MFIGYTDELRDFILLTPLFAILQTYKSGNLTQNKKNKRRISSSPKRLTKKQKKDFRFTKKINQNVSIKVNH